MNVIIHSLAGTLFQDEAQALTIKTTTGEITVLNHHRPLVTMLAHGEARLKRVSGEIVRVSVESGFLEVSEKGDVRVLVD
ncbi:MAG: F0F1 ATP synthase subunit epsilon [Patescibacteria group bacterium]